MVKLFERFSERFWESPIVDRVMWVFLALCGGYMLTFFVMAVVKLIKL